MVYKREITEENVLSLLYDMLFVSRLISAQKLPLNWALTEKYLYFKFELFVFLKYQESEL